MDRVASFNAYGSVIANLMAGELRQNQAQQQISSGKVATDLKGFGADAQALTAAKTVKIRVEGFVQNAKALSAKLDAQDIALNQVADAAQGARQAIANAVATDDSTGLMSALQTLFGQAVSGLNTQYDGHFLFSGGRVDTPPVAAQSLSDLASPPPGGVFQNDQLKTVNRLDETTTVQTGLLASDVGQDLFNALQSIQTYDAGAGGPFNGKLTVAQSAYLSGMLQTFDAASQGLTNVVADNGLMQNRVSQAQTTQEDRQTTLETMIGGITDVDVAEAATRLSQSQLALQASAQVFASLQNTSLLNYLSTPGH
jgi:flagellar hook-associated protein 3 FlgL